MDVICKLLGSVGVLLTAVGFLMITAKTLYEDGFGGKVAQGNLRVQGPLSCCDKLIMKVEPIVWWFYSWMEAGQKITNSLENEQRRLRKKENRYFMGALFIIIGSTMQASAYWCPVSKASCPTIPVPGIIRPEK